MNISRPVGFICPSRLIRPKDWPKVQKLFGINIMKTSTERNTSTGCVFFEGTPEVASLSFASTKPKRGGQSPLGETHMRCVICFSTHNTSCEVPLVDFCGHCGGSLRGSKKDPKVLLSLDAFGLDLKP